MQLKELFEGVYLIDGKLATKNLVKSKKVYNERLFQIDGVEYREWDIYKSKLAAAIKKGLKSFPFNKDSIVLYLGASSGTTVSHLSDIILNGKIFAVEFAQRPMRDLLELCKLRENIFPIFEDANHPEKYYLDIKSKVDIIYQDVAQPNQAEILLKNSNYFLEKNGQVFLCIKSQSIDVLQSPQKIYNQTISFLELNGFKTIQKINLEPYDKDHLFWHGIKI